MRKTIAGLILLSAVTAVPAQQRSTAMREAMDAVTRRFEAAAPAIGETVPDVDVYDAKGNKKRLGAMLKDHYTVIVLGCLT